MAIRIQKFTDYSIITINGTYHIVYETRLRQLLKIVYCISKSRKDTPKTITII